MALVAFLRGINVGGHRTFRPSELARNLSAYEAVNVGAAGTFVVFRPGSRAKFLDELRRRMPFDAIVALCDGADLIQLETDNPFGTGRPDPNLVRFVSILTRAARQRPALPLVVPQDGEWFVRILGSKNRLVYGEYRRHMKTIGCLGEIDRLFQAPAATRSWTTILSVLRVLRRG